MLWHLTVVKRAFFFPFLRSRDTDMIWYDWHFPKIIKTWLVTYMDGKKWNGMNNGAWLNGLLHNINNSNNWKNKNRKKKACPDHQVTGKWREIKKSKRVPGTICEDVPMQETNEKQKEMGKKRRDKKRSKQNLSTPATWATNPSTSISRPKFESTG